MSANTEFPTQGSAAGKSPSFKEFMAAVIALDGNSLVNDLREAEAAFPELMIAFKYLSIHASASVVAGNTFRRGNLVADCGPAVAQLTVAAANTVINNPALARTVVSRINAHYIQAAMEKSMDDGEVAEPTLVDETLF
jgi:hypothetical protein